VYFNKPFKKVIDNNKIFEKKMRKQTRKLFGLLLIQVIVLNSCIKNVKTPVEINVDYEKAKIEKNEVEFESDGEDHKNLLKGLLAFYPFNGNANDLSGNNNHGQVTGASLTLDRFGQQNKAYAFSTSGWTPGNRFNEIFVPYSSSLVTSTLSVCAWIRPSKFYIGQETIIDKYDGGILTRTVKLGD